MRTQRGNLPTTRMAWEIDASAFGLLAMTLGLLPTTYVARHLQHFMLNSNREGAQLMKAPHNGPERVQKANEKRHFDVLTTTRSVKTPTLWVVLLALVLPGAAHAGGGNLGEWQSLDSIRNAAETFVRKQLSQKQKLFIQAGSLDARLRLPQCAEELVAFLSNGYSVGSNTAVGVRCRAPKAWKLFVPVRVAVLGNVLVANRPLARGAEITPADLSLTEKEVTTLTGTYFTEQNQIQDMRLRRSVKAGEILVSSMLEASYLVHRGQTVTLIAKNSSVQIRATGKALSDGAINQRIRVENLSSNRIVEGVVRSREKVEILLE